MKKLTKIWGIGLVVILVASLLLSAAPVAASELAWGTEGIPSATDNIIVNGIKIQDFAVSGDGQTIYAVDGANTLVYKSTNGGKTWGTKTPDLANPLFVAVAPDDPDLAVVATATQLDVTTNGGGDWTTLGATIADGVNPACAAVRDIAISPDDSGNHYIAVAGEEAAGTGPANLWSYKLGSTGAAWDEQNDKNGFLAAGTGIAIPGDFDQAIAVAFSPAFASDKMVLFTAFDTTVDTAYLLAYSFNYSLWNIDASFTSYPVSIVADAGTALTACTGDMTVSPEYLGSDDAMRTVFVGLDATGAAATDDDDIDGIYRLNDTSVKDLKQNIDVFSIAYDGTNLVAGQVSGSAVYRCSDPLASSPTVSTASSLKRLLGTNVRVAWTGSDVVASTRGAATISGFGISRDNGKSFNGLSLMDYSAAAMTLFDMDVSADGSTIYLLTGDGTNSYALWRKASDWEMVFSKQVNPTMPMVRVAPDDADSVYIAEDMNASQTMYYSNAGGDTKWFLRTAKANVVEMTVESSDILYTSNVGNVYRSTNNGFTWGSAVSAGVGTVFQMKSLGEDLLVAGGNGGIVRYSTDGAATWSKPHATKYPFAAGNVFVTASGLDDGDFIYCASAVTGQNIVRWELGSSTSWSDIITGTVGGTAEVGTGIALSPDGVLYVLVNDPGVQTGYYRTLDPAGAGSSTGWSTAYQATPAAFTTVPDALTLTEGSTKVWAIDAVGNAVYSYEDTLGVDNVAVSGPADGADVQVNPVSGVTLTVSFSWSRLSKATAYDHQIALDTEFKELVQNWTAGNLGTVASTSSKVANVIAGGVFMPETTYYWRVRVATPIQGQWSETRSFSIAALPEAQAPVIIQQPPAPVIEVPPAPEIILQPPDIILPAPTPAPEIVIPAAPAPAPAVPSWAIYAIIIIGAVLVIALIVLIMRTRRPV